ncbi:hypothetical protein KFE25_006041 [Diacronema lutheri]|uniref:Radical S-adenosyl methionine domain-containing protein 1, mitochondrial n=1 Tax=Diacronema lutheri TaxID=2081491 RepID=A0A8J5XID0_DIALT|nr:hypothetical protein KFE25_006041 [Diacronema lutheri]
MRRANVLLAAVAPALAARGWPVHPHAPALHAYVHVPFCRRRCYYCDFPVSVVGDRPQAARDAVERYLEPLQREIRAVASCERAPGAPPLQTIYIGGGTPSLAPASAIGEILAELRSAFGLADGAEVTLEMDPGTFDEASLAAFIACGVTRASIGVQSFDAARLTAAGRAHTVDDAAAAIACLRRARAVGALRSWSLDLIGGLPGESAASWDDTLRAAIAARPDHVSVYDLTVEPRTAYGRRMAAGTLRNLPSEEASADMYRAASALLGGAGYEHYEVSSYALPGHRSRHNGGYWRNAPFFAFGNGAASYVRGVRFSRPRALGAYAAYVGEYERRGHGAQQLDGEHVGPRDWLLETVMVGLRRSDGLQLDELARAFGRRAALECARALAPAEARGLVVRVPPDPTAAAAAAAAAAPPAPNDDDGALLGSVRLSAPDGFLVSNDLLSDLFVALAECPLTPALDSLMLVDASAAVR